MSLAQTLERATDVFPAAVEAIRNANGDAVSLLHVLDGETAASVALWLLNEAPDEAQELLRLWSDSEAGIVVIGQIETEGLSKSGRKILRKVEHHLRARGVALPERKRQPVIAKLPSGHDELQQCFLSAIDPSGARLVIWIERNPSGGVRLFEIVADQARGILECEAFTTTRSKARAYVKELQQRAHYPALSVPVLSIKAYLHRVAGRQDTKRPVPRSFAEFASRLKQVEEGALTPGESVRGELAGAEGSPQNAKLVLELINNRALGPWPPDGDLLREVVKGFEEQAASVVVVSDATRNAQQETLLSEAAKRFYGGEQSHVMAERLEESAYFFYRQDELEHAKACLAAAQQFREIDPSENPTARALLEVLLGPLMKEHEEAAAKEEESPVIITP